MALLLICPADGGPLCNHNNISEMFTLQCTDVWNKVCSNVRCPAIITNLCFKYLITTFRLDYIGYIHRLIISNNGILFLSLHQHQHLTPKEQYWSGPVINVRRVHFF